MILWWTELCIILRTDQLIVGETSTVTRDAPCIVDLLRRPDLSTNISDRRAAFGLTESGDDLILRERLLENFPILCRFSRWTFTASCKHPFETFKLDQIFGGKVTAPPVIERNRPGVGMARQTPRVVEYAAFSRRLVSAVTRKL